MSDDDETFKDFLTPPELREAAKQVKNELLPEKSKTIYMTTYKTFLKWKCEHKAKSSSESVLMAYFFEWSKEY